MEFRWKGALSRHHARSCLQKSAYPTFLEGIVKLLANQYGNKSWYETGLYACTYGDHWHFGHHNPKYYSATRELNLMIKEIEGAN